MSHVVYGNELVRVGLVSTHVRTGWVRVEFFEPVCVTGRTSVGIFFVTLNPNPTRIQPVDTICHPLQLRIEEGSSFFFTPLRDRNFITKENIKDGKD